MYAITVYQVPKQHASPYAVLWKVEFIIKSCVFLKKSFSSGRGWQLKGTVCYCQNQKWDIHKIHVIPKPASLPLPCLKQHWGKMSTDLVFCVLSESLVNSITRKGKKRTTLSWICGAIWYVNAQCCYWGIGLMRRSNTMSWFRSQFFNKILFLWGGTANSVSVRSLELTCGFHRCYLFKDNISGAEEDGRGGVLRRNPRAT